MDEHALVAELVRAHRAHTIVLYGSRARGDWSEESDVDVVCLADVPATYRDARVWQGMYLDGFVHPTALADEPITDDHSKLIGGRVLLDERNLAHGWLARIAAHDAEPIAPLPPTERDVRRVWARKMAARAQRGDVEGNYRYHWLLFQLLEDYYAMIGRRYLGPKRAFAELALRDPETLAAFERALVPGAEHAALAALVAHLEKRYDEPG
jgi:hypothetical protein